MRLGADGYAFAKIDAVPKLDGAGKQVALSLVVDAGNRAYVRRINFHGTSSVNDEVFRRELRQLEGAYLSNAAVERSKIRLQRLPFVEEVEVETTGNKGWMHKQDLGVENPILPSGYGKVVWGQGKDEVGAATGALAEGPRLVETRAEGPVEAVAYNFREGGLWYVEERYRVLAGRTLEDFLERASEHTGRRCETRLRATPDADTPHAHPRRRERYLDRATVGPHPSR